MVKNYIWINILAILSCQEILQGQDSQDYKPVPTQHVMYYLSKSGTKWRGNSEWIKDLEKGASIETNYLHTHDTSNGNSKKYTGIAVMLHDDYSYRGKVPFDTVKSIFSIVQANDKFNSVIITSSIEDTKVHKATNLQEIEKVISDIEKYNNDAKEEEKTDLFSDCSRKITTKFYDSNNKLEATVITSCETRLPFHLFKKEIEKNRNEFN